MVVYPLSRGSQQAVRVNLLQSLWHSTNGFLLHPLTLKERAEPLKVADVGTASGLWLCEVDKEQSGLHKLFGFDVSDSSFIAAEDLPPTVRLVVSDAHKAPPEDFKGYFDVVHIRLLQSVVTEDDPRWLISYCKQLLKPGGYLQWEELDPIAMEVVQSRNGTAESLSKLREMLRSRVPGSWIRELPSHLQKHGMKTLAIERKSEPAYHHVIMTYCFCLVFDEYANVCLESQGQSESAEAVRQLTSNGFQEALQGSYAQHVFQTVLARKSS